MASLGIPGIALVFGVDFNPLDSVGQATFN